MNGLFQIFALVLFTFVLNSVQGEDTVGWCNKDRGIVDSGSDQTFVDKRIAFPENGVVTGWKVYTRAQLTVFLQVWRPESAGSCRLTLVGQTELNVDSSNVGDITIDLNPSEHIIVQAGDLIGWHNPSTGVIPFDTDLSSTTQNHCFKYGLDNTVGQTYDVNGPITWGPDRVYSLAAVYEAGIGFEPKNRVYVDSGSGQVFVDKRLAFSSSGEVTGWNLYAGGKGTIYLQVWRPESVGSCTMELVGQTMVTVDDSNLGYISVDLDPGERIRAESGDLIGWHNPGKGVIKFETQSSSTQHQCFKYGLDPKVGETFSIDAPITWGPDRVYSLAARYDTGIGFEPKNRAYVDSGSGQVFVDKRLAFSTDGVITGWELYAGGKGTVYLQVWRPASEGSCTMELVGQTEVVVDDSNLGYISIELCSDEDRFCVEAGDLIGWHNPGKGVIKFETQSSSTQHQCFKYGLDPKVGETFSVDAPITWGPDRVYSLRANYI
ncbi:uncharacterized protein LOC144440263 [Glandiceps talaboti]